MNNTTIRYNLSKDALDREYVSTGKRSFTPARTIVLDDTALTEDQRRVLVEAHRLNLFRAFPPGLDLERLTVSPATALFNAGDILHTPYTFEAEPSVTDIFKHVELMLEDATRCAYEAPLVKAEAKRLKAERDAANKAAGEKIRLEYEAKQQAKRDEKERTRLERMALVWNGDSFVGSLFEAIFAASALVRDSRFKTWIKEVQKVDKTQENGYSFVGPWISEGTVEITDRAKRRVYLVASTTGSRRNQTTEYVVVEMVGGTLYRTTIETTSSSPGWALRIRDQIAALVGE